MRNIDFIREVTHTAAGQWQSVLSGLGIAVSDSPLRHTPCPACGGTDRFRFDDNGRGAHICNQCGAGDGLDLIKKVNGCDTTEAAQLVAEVLGIDYRTTQTDPSAAIERQALQEAERLQRELTRQELAVQDTEHRRLAFARRYAAMRQNVTQGESDYLKSKGLNGFTYQLLTDGTILLPLVDNTGVVTAAQTITSSGEKRLVVDSAKRGAFHAINAPEQPQEVILAEGLATALSVHLMRPDALTVCAVDAGNLLHAAIQMRQQHPQAQIIIAADNDFYDNQTNTGKEAADKAAIVVAGWVALPPGEHKADWNDHHQQYGLAETTSMFTNSLYQAQGESVKSTLQGISHSKQGVSKADSVSELGGGEALNSEELQALKDINRTYTHVTIGGKHRVVSLKPCQVNGMTHAFEDLSQFRNYFHHMPKIAKKSAGSAWLHWPGKNYKPDGVGFYPDVKKCPPDVFNLYSGLSVTSIDADCSPYTEHLKNVICAGDNDAYQYLIGWLAHLIQKPDEKPSVAIVMKSVPGTGKGTTVKPLLEILGQYAVHINGAGQIAGRFNSTLANKLLIFADEVTVRNRAEADKLKGIISESSVNLERKGIDAEPMPNFARLIFASNSSQTLLAGVGERRYLVLEPDPSKAQVKDYFDHLHTWVNNGGAGKLLHLLQHFDLQSFDRHRAPQTSALREEILQGLSGANLFLYTEIVKDRPFDGMARIAVSSLVDKFLFWSQEQGEIRQAAAARTLVGKAMVSMKLKSSGRPGRGDGVIYELPDSETLREAFAQSIGMGGGSVF